MLVSILILLDYLFLYMKNLLQLSSLTCLNPYFIGLPILMRVVPPPLIGWGRESQSLFYWITYSYPTAYPEKK